MGRAPCCEKVGLKRGRWTSEEDVKLTNYILQHGQGSWRSLPKNAGLLRCGKSCRLRWINYLKSDLKRGDITPQEEDIIIKLHASLGNRWSAIAAQLSGRTDNEIKNYWNSHLSRRIHTIRKPNGEENVINLTNASAPPKRRGGKTSRATKQKNQTNNLVNNKDDVNPISSNTNNNNNNNPQLSPTLDENFMFNPEQGLSIEDMMGLDGLLLTTKEGCFIEGDVSPNGPNDGNGVEKEGPFGEEQEQCNGLGLAHVSTPIGFNSGGLTSPSSSSSSSKLSCFDGGISWDTEIGMVDDVGSGFQLCNDEKEHLISWLWENDDNYLGEPDFSDLDSDKEQAMAAWLLS